MMFEEETSTILRGRIENEKGLRGVRDSWMQFIIKLRKLIQIFFHSFFLSFFLSFFSPFVLPLSFSFFFSVFLFLFFPFFARSYAPIHVRTNKTLGRHSSQYHFDDPVSHLCSTEHRHLHKMSLRTRYTNKEQTSTLEVRFWTCSRWGQFRRDWICLYQMFKCNAQRLPGYQSNDLILV